MKEDNNTHDNEYPRSHMEDLLALYALGGLTDEEIQQVEAHVADHPQAAADLADFMKTVEQLPFAAVPMKPSAEMEALLMERVETNSAARFSAQAADLQPHLHQSPSLPAEPPSQPTPQTFWERLSALFSQPLFSGAAVALALLALMWAAVLNWQNTALNQIVEMRSAENFALNTAAVNAIDELESLQEENDTLASQIETLTADNETLADQLTASEADTAALQNQLADQQLVLDLFASPNTQTVSLPGTAVRPEATGQLLIDPNSNIALLVVSDLQPLEEGQVYQVLLIRDDGHDTADTFIVDAEGENVLLVHSQTPLNDFTAVGVSIEPEGGSPQRAGDIIILGEL